MKNASKGGTEPKPLQGIVVAGATPSAVKEMALVEEVPAVEEGATKTTSVRGCGLGHGPMLESTGDDCRADEQGVNPRTQIATRRINSCKNRLGPAGRIGLTGNRTTKNPNISYLAAPITQSPPNPTTTSCAFIPQIPTLSPNHRRLPHSSALLPSPRVVPLYLGRREPSLSLCVAAVELSLSLCHCRISAVHHRRVSATVTPLQVSPRPPSSSPLS
ncbi:hypothetical protein PIB30_025376 [Stylosanthes scabra]|uniref:Uncharacterized protein n=1 Tax=Stylosanthes scabra TaxID=79078 RepID=A0ABU6Z9S1_9FABA|nr:hypothetical protein [Stylosanthes scabra]